MSYVETFADVEGGLRTWLRTQPLITAQVSTRVFFGIPDLVTFPIITVQRVGGGEQDSGAPIDDALIQFDCWGSGSNKVQAWATTKALIDTLRNMTPQLLDTGIYGFGVSGITWFFSPDPDSGQARYVVTALVTARSA